MDSLWDFFECQTTRTLLIASSQDDNRHIFSVAFAIVEGEMKEAREWFFYNLRTFVTPQPNICIISDRDTWLLAALRTQMQEWCNVESVYCIRHLASNFNKEFRDSDLQDKFIQMGAWLDQIPKAKWAQCYDEGRQYGHMTTNLAECINGVLKGSRALHITALIRTTYYRRNS
ncbi:hypothetical protein Lal_00020841 [Lupinus albus]|nr:hypothetical protein Lal_00020841 [Lupinus albus]